MIDWFRSKKSLIRDLQKMHENIRGIAAERNDYRVASEANRKSTERWREEAQSYLKQGADMKDERDRLAASLETWKALAEKWEKQSAQNLLDWHKEKRSNAALRGQITKLRKEITYGLGGKNGR